MSKNLTASARASSALRYNKEVKVVPDSKTQFKVVFEALEKVPDELLDQSLFDRHDEVKNLIDFPYTVDTEDKKKETKAEKRKKNESRRKSKKY